MGKIDEITVDHVQAIAVRIYVLDFVPKGLGTSYFSIKKGLLRNFRFATAPVYYWN